MLSIKTILSLTVQASMAIALLGNTPVNAQPIAPDSKPVCTVKQPCPTGNSGHPERTRKEYFCVSSMDEKGVIIAPKKCQFIVEADKD